MSGKVTENSVLARINLGFNLSKEVNKLYEL